MPSSSMVLALICSNKGCTRITDAVEKAQTEDRDQANFLICRCIPAKMESATSAGKSFGNSLLTALMT